MKLNIQKETNGDFSGRQQLKEEETRIQYQLKIEHDERKNIGSAEDVDSVEAEWESIRTQQRRYMDTNRSDQLSNGFPTTWCG